MTGYVHVETRNVLILECDHMFQTEEIDPSRTAPSWDSTKVQQEQKNLFLKKIEQVLNENPNVSLIAEEAVENQRTFAFKAASRRGIPYVNINLFRRHQKERGFPENYLLLPEPQQVPYDRIREQYFFDQTKAILPLSGEALFICGKRHVDNMKTLFERNGYQTTLIRLTVAEGFNWEWFIEPFHEF